MDKGIQLSLIKTAEMFWHIKLEENKHMIATVCGLCVFLRNLFDAFS